MVQVLWSGNIGGIETLTIDLCDAQVRNPGIRVELLIAKNEGPNMERISKLSIVQQVIGLKNGFDFSVSKFRKMKQVFSAADVIHLHFFNLLIVHAAIRSGKKIVFTEHGNFGFGRKKTLTDRLNAFLLKNFLRSHVSFVTFNSEFTAGIAEQRYDLDRKNGEVVYNGIDFSVHPSAIESTPELVKKLEGKFVVGTSSRFAGFKRIDRLIRAFAEFQKNKNTMLLLVGDGILRQELEELVRQLNLEEKTIFTGYRKDARQLQQRMDMCVFPSENEPFGLVAIEAWSLGKPVVVFRDGGGIAELTSKISEADVVRDEKELAQRMDYYFDHPIELVNGKNARVEFAKKFDIRIMEKKFYEIYKRII
ncbi:MAG: glycosyltransferase family 4 protein [Bacteroidetes bacterium]|nr:glycosyltransferase family 4 protein [Bacteroidota bacterium]